MLKTLKGRTPPHVHIFMTVGGEPCWFCHGQDDEVCPVCTVAKTDKMEESGALCGQDGWCSLEDPEELSKKSGWQVTTIEGFNLKLLCQAEDLLRKEDAEGAFDLANRVCRNLEKHLDAVEGRSTKDATVRALLRRGEREVFCLSFSERARCLLLKQDFKQVVEDCNRYSRVLETVTEKGDVKLLHQHEKKIMKEGRSALGNIPILGAAAEIAHQCRDRVAHGFGPKLVLDHSQRALNGLQALERRAFPGLDALRAHLHVTRAQALLELERWEEAKEEAKTALELDRKVKEADYMLQCAERQEW